MERSGLIRGLCGVGLGGLLALVLIDLALAVLPVRTPLGTLATNDQNPIIHFQPDHDFTFSLGWDFRALNHGHINNAGFINDQNYRADATTPLLAVFGNSYIEATMVPYAQTLQGRLAQALQGEARVYSFGVSGSHLAQYLAFAELAKNTYHPSAMVFLVTNGDILESLFHNATDHYGHYYYVDHTGTLALQRVDFSPGYFRHVISLTALGQYLFFNLNGQLLLDDTKISLFGVRPPASSATPSPGRIESESRAVSAAFFRDLPHDSGLPPDKILFVIDGPHSPKDSNRYFGSEIFRAAALAHGYRAIDMKEVFAEHYRPNERVDISAEIPTDNHWNGRGHGLAAEEVLQSGFLSQALSLSRVPPPSASSRTGG